MNILYEFLIPKKMNNTLDRFRGAWLGSMLGSSIELRKGVGKAYRHENNDTLLQFFIVREQLAEIAIESQTLNAEAIADLLVERKPMGDRSSVLAEYSYCLLSLLPLIIFYGDNWNLLEKIVRKYCLKLGSLSNSLELEADTLLWSYLITSIFHSGLELNGRHFSQSIGQILNKMAVKKTALIGQLEIVITAIERGVSLEQLSDELLPRGNSVQRAIALSCYCFATTATDFKLSVQRASNIDPEIAKLATALTGTVSGAYNGMARIPLSWKKMAKQDTAYSLASQTTLKLFRAWLGVHPVGNELSSNIENQAIAIPSLIQTRKTLKIISQKSLFN